MSDQINRNTGGGPSNNDSTDKSIDRIKTTPGQIKAMIGFFEIIPSSWNFKSVGKRFERHLSKYRDTERNKNSTCFGLTADDIKRGLTTIEIKCEHLCIGFSRLAALHGVRPNITPFCVAFHGAPGGTEYTYANRVRPSLAAIEVQTFAVFGGQQEAIEEVSQLLVGSDAAESSTRSSAPLSSGAPLAARSLSIEPVSTERSCHEPRGQYLNAYTHTRIHPPPHRSACICRSYLTAHVTKPSDTTMRPITSHHHGITPQDQTNIRHHSRPMIPPQYRALRPSPRP
ncbi:hypothetical protein INT47_008243 [Mucor saturninus]|uniref:Uncharacterized protein n=1 Tax=Mucor saturninus TaxID=64648 RepID=A0A8H7UT93_9FUNG|nr:hypothetical protein INT47_008243 [Mucor saturninus]